MSEPSAEMRPSDDQPNMRDFLAFLRRICNLLIQSGCSSNRVELLTQILGESWGYEVETVAIPTAVWINVRTRQQTLHELTRVRRWSIDLDRLARLNELVESVRQHQLSISDANARLNADEAMPPPYGKILTLLAGALTSPILILSYGGTPLTVALGVPAGILVQYLNKYLFSSEQRRYLGDFLIAASMAAYAYACRAFIPAVDAPLLIIGGIVVIVPGLTLVNAVHEVAQKNLVSGAAKLLEALMITASLGFGVAFVLAIMQIFISTRF